MDINLLQPHYYHNTEARRQRKLAKGTEPVTPEIGGQPETGLCWGLRNLAPPMSCFANIESKRKGNCSDCLPCFLELNILGRGWTKSQGNRPCDIGAGLEGQGPCLLLQLWVMTERPPAPFEVSGFLPIEWLTWRQFPGRSPAFKDSV